LGLLISPFCSSSAEAKDFVVVIDAGHGGHDPGAVGKISKEKNINLNVALKLGKQIQKNCPDVKVVYTRTRDVFIPLDRRAEIANNAKADLFISIHTNALAKNRTAKGASTWTLGLAKSDANLEVAKRENSVILYESDYKTRYAIIICRSMKVSIRLLPNRILFSNSCRISICRKAYIWPHSYKSISVILAAGWTEACTKLVF
jgi:N-acetylmuramoyl-L-alanine amidase